MAWKKLNAKMILFYAMVSVGTNARKELLNAQKQVGFVN